MGDLVKDLFKDIPAPTWLRFFVWCMRSSRSVSMLQRLARDLRQRTMLGPISKLHIHSTHQMRSFSIHKYMARGIDSTLNHPYEPFESLANANRDVFADLLEIPPQHLHCTIKICNNEKNMDKKDWKVYTIARSTPYNRPEEFHPEYHLVGENSSFAPLVGCDDIKNIWLPHVYRCFVSDDLTKYFNKYACSRKNWNDYFKSTIVFPLRYRKGRTSHLIIGFLTFDSNKTKVFGNIPDIFEYKDKPDDYLEHLSYSTAYHIGGIIADTLATTFYLQEN